MLKFLTLISFIALTAHTSLAKSGTLATANERMLLALVFIVLLLTLLHKEYKEFVYS